MTTPTSEPTPAAPAVPAAAAPSSAAPASAAPKVAPAAPPSYPAPARRRTGLWVALVVLVVLVVAGAVVLAPRLSGSADAAASPSASAPGVIPADATVVAEGRAVPVRWAELTATAGGRVATVPVAVGDTVAKGEVVVWLDHDAADLQVKSAQAAKDGAAAALTRALDSLAQARLQVDVASASVDQAQAARRGAVAARDLLPSGASKAAERQADAQVDQASAGVDVAKAQKQAAQAAVGIAQAGVDSAKADEEGAVIAVTSAEVARDSLQVKAPFAGTVVSVEPAVGDVVQPGVVLVRIADPSGWRFETTDLSETSIARVVVGAAAKVTVDGLPGKEIAGTVESVGGFGATSQGDIVFRVVVAPSGPVPDGLRWNMTVTLEIEGVAGS